MTILAAVLMAAMLPAVPLPRGAVTNGIAEIEGAPMTWEAEGTLPLPYGEARARLLTSLTRAKWRLKQTIPMHRQGVSAEILVFSCGGDTPLAPQETAQLYFILQSTGPASVAFNYRRERKDDIPVAPAKTRDPEFKKGIKS